VQKGMFADAQADLEKLRRVDDSPWSLAQSAYIFGRSGRVTEARRAVEKLEQLDRHNQIDPAPILIAYVGIGDKDEAFAWLEKAYSQHSNVLTKPESGSNLRPAAQRPAFPGFAAPRRTGGSIISRSPYSYGEPNRSQYSA